MEDFLIGLIAATPGPLRPVVALVVGGVLKVFQWTNGLLKRVHLQWNPIADAQHALTAALTYLRNEVVNTVKWVILTRIPQWATNTLNWAVRWAGDRINALSSWTASRINQALQWARGELDKILAFARAVRDWATGLFASLLADAKALKDRVFNTWATPLRLAEWLIGSLWTVFWRYAYNQRDRIAQWIWQNILPLLLRFAGEVERQIGRLL